MPAGSSVPTLVTQPSYYYPTLAYYRCPEEKCNEIVTDHLILLSNNKIHDAAAMQEFVKFANEHLIQNRRLSIIKET